MDVDDVPLSEAWNRLCSTRPTLILFLWQHWGGKEGVGWGGVGWGELRWETGRSVYVPYRALWYRLQRRLKLKLNSRTTTYLGTCRTVSSNWTEQHRSPSLDYEQDNADSSAVSTDWTFPTQTSVLVTHTHRPLTASRSPAPLLHAMRHQGPYAPQVKPTFEVCTSDVLDSMKLPTSAHVLTVDRWSKF